jgi:hypothetical protein
MMFTACCKSGGWSQALSDMKSHQPRRGAHHTLHPRREEPQHQPILLQHHLPHQPNPTHTENTVREIPAKYATQKQFYIHF